MDPIAIAQALALAAEEAMKLYAEYQDGKVVLSETDAQAVHAALLQAEQATAALRPLVDAALDAASKT